MFKIFNFKLYSANAQNFQVQTLQFYYDFFPFPDSSDFRQKNVWNPISVGISNTFFYLHTSDNLLPSTYSVRLNVGVSKQNQKSLLQAI